MLAQAIENATFVHIKQIKICNKLYNLQLNEIQIICIIDIFGCWVEKKNNILKDRPCRDLTHL